MGSPGILFLIIFKRSLQTFIDQPRLHQSSALSLFLPGLPPCAPPPPNHHRHHPRRANITLRRVCRGAERNSEDLPDAYGTRRANIPDAPPDDPPAFFPPFFSDGLRRRLVQITDGHRITRAQNQKCHAVASALVNINYESPPVYSSRHPALAAVHICRQDWISMSIFWRCAYGVDLTYLSGGGINRRAGRGPSDKHVNKLDVGEKTLVGLRSPAFCCRHVSDSLTLPPSHS